MDNGEGGLAGKTVEFGELPVEHAAGQGNWRNSVYIFTDGPSYLLSADRVDRRDNKLNI